MAACICKESPYKEKNAFYAHELEDKKLIAGSVGKDLLDARAEEINRKLDFGFETVDPAIAIEFLLVNPECVFIAPKRVLERYPGSLTRQVPLKGLGECSWVFAWKKKAQLSQLAKDYLAFMRKHNPEIFIHEAMERKKGVARHQELTNESKF